MVRKVVLRIKPSKRPKKRYVLFEAKGSQIFFPLELKAWLISFFRDFFKEKFEEKRIWITSFYENEGLGILRCSHLAVEEIKNAFSKIDLIRGKRAKFRVLLVSGSIKKLKKKISKL